MFTHKYPNRKFLGLLLSLSILLGIVLFPTNLSASTNKTTLTVQIGASSQMGLIYFSFIETTSRSVDIYPSVFGQAFGALYNAPAARPSHGYTFDYWQVNDAKYYSQSDFMNNFWNVATVGNNLGLTIYCYFKSTDPTYTITLDTQGGDKNAIIDGFANNKWRQGTAVRLPSAAPTKKDNTFVSWNATKDGKGFNYSPSVFISISNNMYLYAIWRYTAPSSPSPAPSSSPAPPSTAAPPVPSSSSSPAPNPAPSSSGGTGGTGGSGGKGGAAGEGNTGSGNSSVSSTEDSSVSTLPSSSSTSPSASPVDIHVSSVPLSQAKDRAVSAWLVLCIALVPAILFFIVYIRRQRKND